MDEGLFLLDIMAGLVTEMELPWQPQHINVLPTHDRLVLDDGSGDALYLYDPEAMAITKSISLERDSRDWNAGQAALLAKD